MWNNYLTTEIAESVEIFLKTKQLKGWNPKRKGRI